MTITYPPPPTTDYVLPIISVHSWSNAILLGWCERMKLIPPFDTAAKFVRANARPSQLEHIPFVGVYLLQESMSDPAYMQGAPDFEAHTKLGFSYIIQNNDVDAAADILDAAHWSLMKMFHYPNWSRFPFPHPDDPNRMMEVIGVSDISHDREWGNRINETPIAEMRMEMTFVHAFNFEPVPLDNFEIFHMTTVPYPADPQEVKPIITEWVLPKSPT